MCVFFKTHKDKYHSIYFMNTLIEFKQSTQISGYATHNLFIFLFIFFYINFIQKYVQKS